MRNCIRFNLWLLFKYAHNTMLSRNECGAILAGIWALFDDHDTVICPTARTSYSSFRRNELMNHPFTATIRAIWTLTLLVFWSVAEFWSQCLVPGGKQCTVTMSTTLVNSVLVLACGLLLADAEVNWGGNSWRDSRCEEYLGRPFVRIGLIVCVIFSAEPVYCSSMGSWCVSRPFGRSRNLSTAVRMPIQTRNSRRTMCRWLRNMLCL